MTAARIAPLFILCTLLFVARAEAQSRPAFFDEPAEIRVMGTPAANESLPAVVFLPATGGTADEMLARAASAIPLRAYVAILPAGRPQSADYLPRFGDFVGWMDTRLLADIERARAAHTVDASRIYLFGFSLGGDTAYALLLRHPELYRGAVVLGSRSSAQPRGNTLTTLRTRDARVAFGMGDEDDAARVTGMTRAHEKLRDAQIHTVFRRYPGGHTLPPDSATLGELATFVMSAS